MKTPQYICIHHTAVSYKKNPDQWKATDNYHKDKGWGGGGYNYEVAANGSIHQFREDGKVTAAQYQENMNDGRCISICLDGNFDIEEPTDAQKTAVKAFIAEKMAKYGIPKENVFNHRHVAVNANGQPYKSCPGDKLPNNIYSYFFPNMPNTKSDKSQVLSWASEAVEWASNNGFVTAFDLSASEQKQILILYRYHKKFVEPFLGLKMNVNK